MGSYFIQWITMLLSVVAGVASGSAPSWSHACDIHIFFVQCRFFLPQHDASGSACTSAAPAL